MAFCPRCASPASDDAVTCATCGAPLSSVGGAPQPPPPQASPQPYGAWPAPPFQRTNTLALVGFVIGLIGFLFGPLAIIGLVLSIIAYVQCRRSGSALKGRGFAVAGIVLSTVWLVLAVLVIVFAVRANT